MITMNTVLELIQNYGSQASAIGAAASFIFGVFKYLSERKTTMYWKEFDVYHKLVKELSEPHIDEASMYLDRQAAVIYELRNFKRYYSFTKRMLDGLNEKWSESPGKYSRLLNELKLTLAYIKGKA